MLDGDAARALEHRRQVPLADDDVVDGAQDGVDAVQPPNPLRRDLLRGAIPRLDGGQRRDRHEGEQHQARRHHRDEDGDARHRVEVAGALAGEPRPADGQGHHQRDRQQAAQRGAADPVGDDVAHQAGRRPDDEHADREGDDAQRGVRREGREGGDAVQRILAERVALQRDEREESQGQRQRLAEADPPVAADVQGEQRGADQDEVDGGDQRRPARPVGLPGYRVPREQLVDPQPPLEDMLGERCGAECDDGRPERQTRRLVPRRRFRRGDPQRHAAQQQAERRVGLHRHPPRAEPDQGRQAEQPAGQHDDSEDGDGCAHRLGDQDGGRPAVGQP